MSIKTTLLSKYRATLVTEMTRSFMSWLYVNNKITLYSGVVVTLTAVIPYFFMYYFLWVVRLFSTIALKSHYLQSYFTPSCLDHIWFLRLLRFVNTESHWMHLYLTPSCTDLIWVVRLLCLLNLESHCLQ